MLSKNQEKLIKSLQTSKGREATGLCLVEGKKNLVSAKKFLDFSFSKTDTKIFSQLVTTETPQELAGVARLPEWGISDIEKKEIIIILDGVQDPGNVGTILRLCLGFDASLILIESADPSSPKVIRASAGAIFLTPWLKVKKSETEEILEKLKRTGFRLELPKDKKNILEFKISNLKKLPKKFYLIAGSEGNGISLDIDLTSLYIPHDQKLESLNVANALAIILGGIYLK